MSPRTRTASARPRALAVSWFPTLITAVVAALVGGLLIPTAAIATPPAHEQITPLAVTSADADLLAGASAEVTLRTENPVTGGPGDLYNATGVAILPPGVHYVAGSSPHGEPVKRLWVPDPLQPTITGTVLIWENVADLVAGTSATFPFSVTADDETHPVGSSFTIGGGVYAATDERELPIITIPASGPPVVSPPAGAAGIIAGGSVEQTTTVTPLWLSKRVNAAESEIYRGAGRESTFTITVRNAPESPTESIVVTDLLPATFRLVDCECSSEIVEIDGAVFTRLVWDLGTVDGQATRELTYTVRIDETELTLPEAAAPGAPTRPSPTGDAVRNTVTATGHYTGTVATPADAEVTARAETTATVLDLGVVKTVSEGHFTAGGTADFTLHVTGSSITDAGGITLVDVLPDGMCPLVPAGVEVTGAPWPTACPAPGTAATEGTVGNATMTAVEAREDGSFRVTFTIEPLPGTAGPIDVTYRAHFRADYAAGSQTSAGDAFRNTVDIEGIVAPTPGNTVDEGARDATNDSAATVDTERVVIDKRVWANVNRTPVTSAADCPEAASEWTDQADTVAQLDDLVCFRITADLPGGVPVRDAVLTDFVPPGTEVAFVTDGPTSTVPLTAVAGSDTMWNLGVQDGDHWYAAAGGRMDLILVLRVVSAPLNQPQVAGNLAKLRYVSDTGAVLTARDSVDFVLAPPVPLSLDKRATPTTVREGELVTYTIDVTSLGDPATHTAQGVGTIEVWDALPAGFTCAALVSSAPNAAACGEDTVASPGFDDRVIVRWTLSAAARGGLLQPDQTDRITYTLRMPTPLGVGSTHDNLAAVTRYTVPTTDGTVTPPAETVLVPSSPFGEVHGIPNAPAATDDERLTVPSAEVRKSVTTAVEESGNARPGQATIGEAVTYTYSATIPAKTSLFGGRLIDTMPANLVSAGAVSMTVTPAVPFELADGACPAGAVNKVTVCANGTVVFPDTWTNPHDSDVTFTVTLPARVVDTPQSTPAHGAQRVNTATLHARPSAEPGPAPAIGSATATVGIVVPTAKVEKSVVTPADGAKVQAGDLVTFRIVASNPTAGRPPLHDWVVADCAPASLEFVSATPSVGSIGTNAGENCGPGEAGYRWTGSWPLQSGPGGSATALMTFRVPDGAVAGDVYRNVVSITGTTLPGSTHARTITNAPANASVTVATPAVAKTVDKAEVVEGETVVWTVTATIPAKTTLRSVALVDTLGAHLGAAADVVWGAPVCTNGDAAWRDGCGDLFRSRADTPDSAQTQKTGQLLGDLIAIDQERTVSVTLTTTIPVTGQSTPRTITNTAGLEWFLTSQEDPQALPSGSEKSQTATATTNVKHPKVTLTKDASTTTPHPGEVFTYRVVATAGTGNNARTAYDVAVSDVLPEGLELVERPARAEWNEATRTLSWTIPALAPGATFPVEYSVKLAASAGLDGGALSNTATPTSWSSLPEPGGRDYAGTPVAETVHPQFPLVNATKELLTPVGGQVALGENATYLIRLTNAGSADATQVDASDVLPKGWVYASGSARVSVHGGAPVAVEPTQETSAGVTTLSWTNLLPAGTLLAPTQDIVITLAAHPTTADALGGIGLGFAHRNTAAPTRVLDGSGADGNADGPFTGTTGTAVAKVASADLTIAKSAGTFTAGGTGTWTITVGNNGPDPARGVVVSDLLTEVEGVSLVSATGAGWTCSAPAGQALTCHRTPGDELAPGQSWTIIVTGAVAADVPDGTVITNTATVHGSTYDPVPTNNGSTATTKVQTSADLSLVKTATPASVVAGEEITWTIALTNRGPSVSTSAPGSAITVRDPLPSEIISAEIVTASDALECAIDAGELVCTATEDLPVGDTRTVTLRGTVAPSTPAATKVQNTATVTPGGSTDPKPGDNESGTTTPVTTDDRVSITKRLVTDAAEPVVVPGETFTYEVTVTGLGPSDSRGITVTDTLPQDTTFTGVVTGDGWTHTATDGQDVTFALDRDLAPGASATLRYTVLLGASVTEDIINSATAISTTGVPTTPVEVPALTRPEADLGVVWDRERTDIVPGGDPVTLIATVTNHGPSDAHGGTVTFRIPPHLTLVQVPADCREPAEAAPVTIVCDVPLAPGESADFRFEVAAPADMTSSPTLHATTGMTVTDRDPSNDADATVLDPRATSGLTIVKSTDRATAAAGEQVSWTIAVTATGPSDAQHVRIADTLPAELTLVGMPTWAFDDATEQAECLAPGASGFDCLIGTLAAGRSVTVTVQTLIASSTPASTLTNVATATSTTPDVTTGEPIRESDDEDVEITVNSAVTIEKTTVTPTVDAGDTATFELAVTNTGVSDAAAPVTVTDTLPAGLTLVSAAASGDPTWSCTSADDVTVTCVLVDADGVAVSLPAGAKAPTITVIALVAADLEPGTVTNHASVRSATDPGDEDSSMVEITAHADLRIEKSHDAGATLVAGLPFAWDLTVTNDGPSVSVATTESPILVRDVLPAGITLDAAGTDPRCVVAGEEDGRQIVECRQDTTFAVDASTVFSLAVTTDQSLAGVVHNTASIEPGVTPLPDDEPRTDDDELPVIEEANLSVHKRTDATSVTAGTQLTWTIAVQNHGPSDSDATDDEPIRIVDTLPAGVVFASAEGDGWSCTAGAVTADGQEVVCTYPQTLPIGAAPELTFTADIAGDVLAPVTNHVTVEPGQTPQPSGSTDDDTDEVTTPVETAADLSIRKSVHEGFTAGASGVYRLVVTNAGPSDARGVVITDDLPAGLTFEDGAGDGFACTADGQTVVCSLDGTIAVGESAELFLRVAADSALTDDVTNVARVTAETPDPDPSNNEDEVTGTVVTEADLRIEKSHAEGTTLAAGERFAWTFTVTNAGPSDSVATEETPIIVRDVLPAGITIAPDTDAACAATGHDGDREVVECRITETLPVGAARTITLDVLADEALSGTVRNVASVTPGVTPLPDTDPREDDDEVPVIESADLSVHKTANTETATAGGTFSWTIQVRNHGPANSDATVADPIRITDVLPAGVSLVSVDGAGWSCAAGEAEDERESVVCELPTTLAVGDAAPITVTGRVASGTVGDLRNAVTVQPGLTAQPEGPGEPDEDAVTTPVETAANLVLTKVVSQGFSAGESGAYLLTVTNLGPSDARDVRIVDDLPDGLTFESATGEGWSCEADAQLVTCDLDGSLASGATTQVELRVHAGSHLEGDVVNRATVSSSTPDVDPPTSTDEAEGTVESVANLAIEKSSVASAVIGDRVAFTLAVSNTGPADAKGVVVTDVLPAGLTDAEASGDGWTCVTGDAETVTCQRASIAADTDAPPIAVTALVTPAAYPAVRNIATVTSATVDPDPGDDESSVEVVIEPDADLEIAKTQMSELVAAERATYEITVSNVGTTEDPGPITVTDPLPDGLHFVAVEVDQDGAACAADGELVTCELTTLDAGAAVTITVTVQVDADATGEIVNTATVTSPAGTGGEGRTDDATGGVRVPTTPTIPTTGIVVTGLPLAAVLILGGLTLLAVRRQLRAQR